MADSNITIDIALAVEQLKADPALGSMLLELVAPSIAPLMERDAKTIEALMAENATLREAVETMEHKLQVATEAMESYRDRADWCECTKD